MQIIFVTLTYFLFGGSCIYLLLCVDSNDPGILGKLNRLVFSICPDAVKFFHFRKKNLNLNSFKRKYGSKIFGEKFIRRLDGCLNYLCYTNHPIIQVFQTKK